jgi:hypothetical protein
VRKSKQNKYLATQEEEMESLFEDNLDKKLENSISTINPGMVPFSCNLSHKNHK